MITLEDVGRVTDGLVRLSYAFRRLESRGYDLGAGNVLYPSEIHVLEAIGKREGVTGGSIAADLGVTKGAVSQIVRKLFDKKLVTKERNPDYHKETLLSLTRKGRNAFEGHMRLHEAMDADLLAAASGITAGDLAVFERLMAFVERRIEKYIAEGKRS